MFSQSFNEEGLSYEPFPIGDNGDLSQKIEVSFIIDSLVAGVGFELYDLWVASSNELPGCSTPLYEYHIAA